MHLDDKYHTGYQELRNNYWIISDNAVADYSLTIFIGFFLHALFASENYVYKFFVHFGFSSDMIFSIPFVYSIYATFAFTFVGFIFSIISIGPILYFFHSKYKKRLMDSIIYAIFIGLVIRIFIFLYFPDSF